MAKIEPQPIVSLHGSYFCDNYGDILLINLFYKWIKETAPDVLVNLPMAYDKSIQELPDGALRGIRYLMKSRCLLYCGGGYFGEQPRHKLYWSCRNFYRHVIIGIIAIIRKIPIAIIGVEFGPLSIAWFRRIVIWLAKHSSTIVVRNQESFDFLSQYQVKNVILGVDGVLSLNPLKNKTLSSNPSILLHLPNVQFAEDKYLLFINELARRINELGWKEVVFIEDSSGQYVEDYNDIFKALDSSGINHRIEQYVSFDKLIDTIGNADYVVTTKLHVGITAAAMNVPVLSIYNHPKVIRLHKQIGNADNCVSIHSSKDTFARMVDIFFPSKFVLPSTIRERASLNAMYTKQFIANSLYL